MDLIAIYVEDHLALSLGGIRLARRALRENEGKPLGVLLASIIPELEEDRETLARTLRALGGTPSRVKETAVAAGELLGRLKPNGRLLGYSPLSRVWELEALVAGSDSRRGAFTALARAQRDDSRLAGYSYEALAVRAAVHRDAFERERIRAAEIAFARPDERVAGRPIKAV